MTIEKLQKVLNLSEDIMTEDQFFEVKEKLDRITKTISVNDLIFAIGDATERLTESEAVNFVIYMKLVNAVVERVFPDEAEEIMRIFDEEGGSEQ